MPVVTRGFDCGFGPPTVSSAQASPYGHFWAAYLRKRTASGIHVLTAATLAAYKAARIPLVFLYEDADPARMFNSGRAGGITDTQQAIADLSALGITDFQAIYFCGDTDTNSTTWPKAADYLDGVTSELAVKRTGLYGEADLIDYIRPRNLASWFFQPKAWSGTRIADGVHLYQGNSETHEPWQVVIGGVTCDVDEALQANYGQWPAPAAPKPAPDPAPSNEEIDDMFILKPTTAGTYLLVSGAGVTVLADGESVSALQSAGVKYAKISDADFARVKALVK